MTEPVAYMWKTERGTIIGFTPNDNSHSGGQLGIPLYTAEQLHPMKWFVRSKQQYQPDMDQGISESGYLYLTQGNIYSIEYYETTSFKDDAQQFETKEEAELWLNPLTEAVQLPVEGE
ncbi:hypothetical protein EFN72_07255 [Leuconostoc citreum]|uniref:hypothetical protein n=1 Tax=Leuconostoc citreum TaxID=33964 RepID=UPI0021A46369|nr:hypothetical protein [Leuconostoc citreum]MCT3059057.1 hypothetical protein [Leuconostoc citreum]